MAQNTKSKNTDSPFNMASFIALLKIEHEQLWLELTGVYGIILQSEKKLLYEYKLYIMLKNL